MDRACSTLLKDDKCVEYFGQDL